MAVGRATGGEMRVGSGWGGTERNDGADEPREQGLQGFAEGLRLAGKVEKIREVVCSFEVHVPIRGAWPGRAAGATVRRRPGESRMRGTSASRSFSGRMPS